MGKVSYISKKRIEKGLSVTELAEKTGVHEEEAERWESGKLPDSEHLLSLSAVLDVPVEDILCGGDRADTANADGKAEKTEILQESGCETKDTTDNSVVEESEKPGTKKQELPAGQQNREDGQQEIEGVSGSSSDEEIIYGEQ